MYIYGFCCMVLGENIGKFMSSINGLVLFNGVQCVVYKVGTKF
jgi:hypothetical protein